MTTITLEDDIKIDRTKFANMLDLYDFIVENQIITEVGVIEEKDLDKKTKKLLEKSRNSSKTINI
ncbi:MAG: hypothetical protein PHN31_05975 [Candidatus Gracilibacteria bacterium]|nr:hypothetical protein [Candidatus Gracilibacteria bacterium]